MSCFVHFLDLVYAKMLSRGPVGAHPRAHRARFSIYYIGSSKLSFNVERISKKVIKMATQSQGFVGPFATGGCKDYVVSKEKKALFHKPH